MVYFAQDANVDDLLLFDYGTEQNMIKYGQQTPP
jgi:hypothetical protein